MSISSCFLFVCFLFFRGEALSIPPVVFQEETTICKNGKVFNVQKIRLGIYGLTSVSIAPLLTRYEWKVRNRFSIAVVRFYISYTMLSFSRSSRTSPAIVRRGDRVGWQSGRDDIKR